MEIDPITGLRWTKPVPHENNRLQFEAAYTRLYPFAVQHANGQKFARDSAGWYEDTPVAVGWTMWQAAVAAERERCAAICDAAASPHNGYDSMGYSIPDPATALAAAIRSRSTEARIEAVRIGGRQLGLATINTAVAHLHALLNSRRTATQALEHERAAREWLDSIGSEAP